MRTLFAPPFSQRESIIQFLFVYEYCQLVGSWQIFKELGKQPTTSLPMEEIGYFHPLATKECSQGR